MRKQGTLERLGAVVGIGNEISKIVQRGYLNYRIATLPDVETFPHLSNLDQKLLWTFRRPFFDLMVRYLPHSRSQLRQDLFVLHQKAFKGDGFFVEFGATNGLDLSNTYLLEKHFGWRGILAEPARCWRESLRVNRSASIDYRCVWKETGSSILFVEPNEKELSTIKDFSDGDRHREARRDGVQYEVPTVSLEELLSEHDAPRHIDYLSIDTEGSEFEILSNFDFSKYKIDIITCEHNFTERQSDIFKLLSAQGYQRMAPHLSRFDDWYVLQ